MACSSLDVHAESPHLGFCSLLYSQFTTIVSASWADSVINVVSATVWAKCQCWHFCFVVGTTFRLSGVRLSSFWMCHSSLLFYKFFFSCYVRESIPLSSHAERLFTILFPLIYHSSSSSCVQRWSWRSASISGLQPPSW